MPTPLKLCEEHSNNRGYRWNPTKCVILQGNHDENPRSEYSPYGQVLTRQTIFQYLGVPIKTGGILDAEELIKLNITKALAIMNLLTSIGVNPSGFDKLLSTRFYMQIVRAQMEYGIAINRFTSS